jgi:hypothetical protein
LLTAGVLDNYAEDNNIGRSLPGYKDLFLRGADGAGGECMGSIRFGGVETHPEDVRKTGPLE